MPNQQTNSSGLVTCYLKNCPPSQKFDVKSPSLMQQKVSSHLILQLEDFITEMKEIIIMLCIILSCAGHTYFALFHTDKNTLGSGKIRPRNVLSNDSQNC